MPREHGRILCRVWTDDDWRARSPEAQRLYFLLLSQRNINNCGVLPLMVSKWARGSVGTTIDDIEKALAELRDHRYVVVDLDTEEALVRSFVRNDGVAKQPNILKSALRQARQIESPLLRRTLAGELRRLRSKIANDAADELDPNPSRIPRDPSPNPSESEPSANPSESHPQPTANPSRTPREAETVREPFAQGCGEGVGEGGKSSSVGGQVGGSRARAPARDDPPPPRCPRHLRHEADGPCGPCGDARRAREQWDCERELEKIMTTRRCRLCDADGWRYEPGTHIPLTPYVRCDHTPLAQEVRHA